MHKNIQTIALVQLSAIVAASLISFQDNNKYEGDNCTLENGDEGICKKLLDCPLKLKKLQGNNLEADLTDRCGFENLVEIICCPNNVTNIATPLPTITGDAPCTLRNGRTGVYKEYMYCKRFWAVAVISSEDESLLEKCEIAECDFSEIVCCPTGELVLEKVFARPSITACEEYKKVIPDQLRSPAIRHGYAAFPGEFPFVAALGYKNKESDNESLPIQYNCAGSLLTLQYVLTAAHCVYNIDETTPVEVLLGDIDVRSTGPNVQRIRIMKIILHPSYKRSKSYNDIAILKLERKAQISATVKPVCLETTPTNVSLAGGNAKLLVTGWGATGLEDERSFVLLHTPIIRSVEKDECASFYTGFAKLPTGIDENMICVIDANKERPSDACHGDSGGPLILRSRYHYSVIGVTSFGQPCGSYVPGIYTAVYPYLDWIEGQVWLNNDAEE